MSFTSPPGIDRLAQLNALHLYGMATAWSELAAEGPRRPLQPEAWLDRLIEAELADRQVRSLRYQLRLLSGCGVVASPRQRGLLFPALIR